MKSLTVLYLAALTARHALAEELADCEAYVPEAHRMQHTLVADRGKWKHARFRNMLAGLRTRWAFALSKCAMARSTVGDFIETGVFTGASSIAMMHTLDAAGASERHRLHYACDSFQGLPSTSKEDACKGRAFQGAAVSKDEKAVCVSMGRGAFSASGKQFEANVAQARVDASRMRVVAGWFNETLPPPGLTHIAFLRLDGDLYASTRDALNALYPLVARGGIVYSDDYGSFSGCARAIDE